jgi:ribosomal protein S18 acetylase RimI-like enzyme
MPGLRLATPADLPALKALVESAYRGDTARDGWTHEADLLDGERVSAAELAATLAAEQHRLIVAEDGQVIGTVTITDRRDGSAYMSMLAVDPLRQTGGLGRKLIAEAERLAASDFAASLMEMTVISPRAELIAYYERRGYARTGEIRPFPVAGIDHLTMVVLTKPIG